MVTRDESNSCWHPRTPCCCCGMKIQVLWRVNSSNMEKHFSLMKTVFIHSQISPHMKLQSDENVDQTVKVRFRAISLFIQVLSVVVFSINVQSQPESIALFFSLETLTVGGSCCTVALAHYRKEHWCSVVPSPIFSRYVLKSRFGLTVHCHLDLNWIIQILIWEKGRCLGGGKVGQASCNHYIWFREADTTVSQAKLSQSETLALLVVNENVHNPHQTPSYVCKYSRCLETERHFFFKML